MSISGAVVSSSRGRVRALVSLSATGFVTVGRAGYIVYTHRHPGGSNLVAVDAVDKLLRALEVQCAAYCAPVQHTAHQLVHPCSASTGAAY